MTQGDGSAPRGHRQPLPYMTKTSWVAAELRRMILDAELLPGDRLPEQEVAGWFLCSPTPVREALRQLGAEGLVDVQPHRVPTVTDLSISEPSEVYIIQAQLQRLAIVLSGRDQLDERVAAGRQINLAMVQCIAAGDFKHLRQLNYEFHFSLFDGRRLHWMTRIISGLWARLPEVLSSIPGRAEKAVEEHAAILEALQRGDVVTGGRLMVCHLDMSADARAKSPKSEGGDL